MEDLETTHDLSRTFPLRHTLLVYTHLQLQDMYLCPMSDPSDSHIQQTKGLRVVIKIKTSNTRKLAHTQAQTHAWTRTWGLHAFLQNSTNSHISNRIHILFITITEHLSANQMTLSNNSRPIR